MTLRPKNPPFQSGHFYRNHYPFERNSGEAHRTAKLTDAQVEEIRKRKAGGESARSIAVAFSISKNYVHELCRFGRRATPTPRTTQKEKKGNSDGIDS